MPVSLKLEGGQEHFGLAFSWLISCGMPHERLKKVKRNNTGMNLCMISLMIWPIEYRNYIHYTCIVRRTKP